MHQKGKVTHFHFPTQILEMAVMDRAFVESGKAKVRKDKAGQVKSEPTEGREHLVNQQQDQKDHSHCHSLHRPSCSS